MQLASSQQSVASLQSQVQSASSESDARVHQLADELAEVRAQLQQASHAASSASSASEVRVQALEQQLADASSELEQWRARAQRMEQGVRERNATIEEMQQQHAQGGSLIDDLLIHGASVLILNSSRLHCMLT